MVTAQDFEIRSLGARRFPSPLSSAMRFTRDDQRVPLDIDIRDGYEFRPDFSFERAGARENLFFDPEQVRSAIVTCGGLCPGLNNVIRSIVMQLRHGYGSPEVFGIRYGYGGLDPDRGGEPAMLYPEMVSEIHKQGGSLLGSSRGPVDAKRIVEFLRRRRINILFAIGGDGTQRGALDIDEAARDEGYALSVIGVPKTIDNDIPYVFRTFGYLTAVEKSAEVIESAHNEARGVQRGIGLVKLMGRHAGYIAAGATLTSQEVNYCLIPEVPFYLEGAGGLFDLLAKRLAIRSHAVIVVAEGAGQHLLEEDRRGRDASGNPRFGDIGVFLAGAIREYFSRRGEPVELKYLDPSYYIRAAPANSSDALACDQLARNAVHAAMAGKTGIVVGLWHGVMTHVPISLIAKSSKRLTEDGEVWQSVLKTTGQPARIGFPPVDDPH
jgi:6-phosphofructokinase 1